MPTRSIPRWLLPAGIPIGLAGWIGYPSPVPSSVAASAPPIASSVPVAFDPSRTGIWTPARKRAARRICADRNDSPIDYRACTRTIPNDGDWGAMGRPIS